MIIHFFFFIMEHVFSKVRLLLCVEVCTFLFVVVQEYPTSAIFTLSDLNNQFECSKCSIVILQASNATPETIRCDFSFFVLINTGFPIIFMLNIAGALASHQSLLRQWINLLSPGALFTIFSKMFVLANCHAGAQRAKRIYIA